ncbi:MAG: flagellar assembly protein FliW [Spirochaetota bacterium]
MQIYTKPYGTIEVDERQKINFPFGILGFENLKNYALIDALQQPFYWLQSLDVPEIAFVLINPFLFRPDYTIDIPDEELEEIGITKPEDCLVFTIVTIPENQTKMTANLQGPILINKNERIARQAISTNPKWRIRHYILEELAAVKDEVC